MYRPAPAPCPARTRPGTSRPAAGGSHIEHVDGIDNFARRRIFVQRLADRRPLASADCTCQLVGQNDQNDRRRNDLSQRAGRRNRAGR